MLDRPSSSSEGVSVETAFNISNIPAFQLQEAADILDAFPDSDLALQTTASLDALLVKAKEIEFKIQQKKLIIQSAILPRYLEQVHDRIAALSDPEAPTVGRDILKRLEVIGCTTRVNPTLEGPAEYLSYHYSRGFVNEVGVNPAKVEDIHSLEHALIHEWPHGFQKHAAEALRFSPLNPKRVAMIHPADWIMLEIMCERDSYTKEGWLDSLLCINDPQVYEKTLYDLVSVEDFNAIRDRSANLQEALTNTALIALNKDKMNPPIGVTFVHHYQEVALRNYQRGIGYKVADGIQPVFLRLEPEDFRAVGDYGVGPNVFGEGPIDPRFLVRQPMLPHVQSLYDSLCSFYRIPPLSECMTMREHEELRAAEKLKAHISGVDLPPSNELAA